MNFFKKTITDDALIIKSIIGVSESDPPFGVHHYNNHQTRGLDNDILLYIIDGGARYDVSGLTFELHSGDLVFVPRRTPYERWIEYSNFHVLYVEFLLETTENIVYYPKYVTNISDIEFQFRKLYKLWISNTPGYYASSMSALYKLLSMIITSHTPTYLSKDRRIFLNNAQNTFLENYTNPDFSISEFVKQANISETYFRKIFKAAYGLPPNQYLISLRINRAKKLLELSQFSIKEISEQIGFSQQAHFSAAFKKATDFSPLEYRKAFKKHDII